jgi:tetratricopeptide (TPR) repeat protein
MNARRGFTVLLISLAALCAGQMLASSAASAGDSRDDPAYPMYQKAYELVLGEHWEEARKAFSQLAEKYPDSDYRDDAEYWIAYSWRDTDPERAMKAYREFLKKYRQSSYFDDALADLDQLMARSLTIGTPVPVPDAVGVGVPVAIPEVVGAFPGDSMLALTLRSLPPPAVAPVMKMRHLERMLRSMSPAPPALADDEERFDDETKLRLEALYAVGRTGEDEKAFDVLRTIAVSPGEEPVVRVAAMEELSAYRRRDVLPVFVNIASHDTSEEMQLYAIESSGAAAHDREKAFDALVKLYGSVPPSKVEKRKMLFYSIAEIGNDSAVDFLAEVAKSGSDPGLRREAVYYLGTIGGEKARTVLIELLGGK